MQKEMNTVTEIKINYTPQIKILESPQIKSSNDAYNCFLNILDHSIMNVKEESAVLFLNQGNRVIGGYKLSTGGINRTVVDIRIVLAIALKCLATGIVLAHTHPSGELKPSLADIDVTQRISSAAKLMDIILLDHLIVSADSYLSFAESGIL
jgi:DNA repair protein RadC